MDSETVVCIIGGWASISALILMFYSISRDEGKDPTYAELALCLCCLPGIPLIAVAITLQVGIQWLWERLDKPIKRRHG